MKKLLQPSGIWAVALILSAAVLLVLTLSGTVSSPPVIYFSYLFSFYALVVLVGKLPSFFRKSKELFLCLRPVQKLMALPAVARYASDPFLRAQVSLYLGFAVNTGYVLMKLYVGVTRRSAWFLVLALYYLVLSVMKLLLLLHVRRKGVLTDMRSEWRRYRTCGLILLGMNVVLAAMVLLVLREGNHFDYPGMLIYAMAAYAFYAVILAVVNLVKFRRRGSPVFNAAKDISLTAALVSLLSLENAMVMRFGDGAGEFARAMNAAVGACVCLVTFVLSLYMIVRATRQLNEN